MTESEKYYMESLYPLQNGILNIVGRLNLPFYLTGGTALSRHYFHHRYSDDLDLFINNDPMFGSYVDRIFSEFEVEERKGIFSIDRSTISKKEMYAQVFVVGIGNVRLKIDLVNDIAAHYGELVNDPLLMRVDSWRNILSNKIAALYRFEPKDVADIWMISRSFKFSWKEILHEAISKELAVDPIAAAEILRGIPTAYLKTVKWTSQIDEAVFRSDIDAIANDILKGTDNSLA
ncbi:MAG TPA: nucleotidyl transferase AbiEii/AbiGii toxin family protein [Bacteroidota bacterium]|nr:nucleotidyl transferase AbiEii/AbiGii toxin family protein [Bacteroidota bacterium]